MSMYKNIFMMYDSKNPKKNEKNKRKNPMQKSSKKSSKKSREKPKEECETIFVNQVRNKNIDIGNG